MSMKATSGLPSYRAAAAAGYAREAALFYSKALDDSYTRKK